VVHSCDLVNLTVQILKTCAASHVVEQQVHVTDVTGYADDRFASLVHWMPKPVETEDQARLRIGNHHAPRLDAPDVVHESASSLGSPTSGAHRGASESRGRPLASYRNPVLVAPQSSANGALLGSP
jgi:hypothetical protein